ncbi:MAG: hypothetical protein KDA75_17060 [Planctomycetaceae bacterium]|nr:hypothetical protein [Planctomycetaceae bacterium]
MRTTPPEAVLDVSAGGVKRDAAGTEKPDVAGTEAVTGHGSGAGGAENEEPAEGTLDVVGGVKNDDRGGLKVVGG